MQKVMIFGTFDEIADRHVSLLKHAADHGDIVTVVVRRDVDDKDAGEVTHNEHDRIVRLLEIDVVDDIVLEHSNREEILRQHKPHIVLLGSHQEHLAQELCALTTAPEHHFLVVRVDTE